MEELEKVPKELKGSATLVGHHWKERPVGHTNFICSSTGERQGQKMGVGGRGVQGEGMGDFWDSIGNVNEENI